MESQNIFNLLTDDLPRDYFNQRVEQFKSLEESYLTFIRSNQKDHLVENAKPQLPEQFELGVDEKTKHRKMLTKVGFSKGDILFEQEPVVALL